MRSVKIGLFLIMKFVSPFGFSLKGEHCHEKFHSDVTNPVAN